MHHTLEIRQFIGKLKIDLIFNAPYSSEFKDGIVQAAKKVDQGIVLNIDD